MDRRSGRGGALRGATLACITSCVLLTAPPGRAGASPSNLVPIPPLGTIASTATSATATITTAAPLVQTATASVVTTSRLSSSEQALASGIDAVRRQRGEAPLATSARLVRAAEEHARSMAHLGYFSHTSADGTVFWRRIARYYPISGARVWSVGENLFWSVSPASSSAITGAWLASPEHRRILLGRWAQVGVAIVHVTQAPGVFGSQNVVIVVADFGSRSR